MPKSIWTLIPRGIKQKDNKNILTLGIYVSPFQSETDVVLKQSLDGTNGTDLWTQWYTYRQQDLLRGINPAEAIRLSINGNTNPASAPPLQFTALPATQDEQHERSAVWQDLLCYQQPDWDGQTFSGPLPTSDCPPSNTSEYVRFSSETLLAANDLPPMMEQGPNQSESGTSLPVMLAAPLPPQEPAAAAAAGSRTSTIYSLAANKKTLAATTPLTALHKEVQTLNVAVTAAKAAQAAQVSQTPQETLGAEVRVGPPVRTAAAADQINMVNAFSLATNKMITSTMDDLVILRPVDSRIGPDASKPSLGPGAQNFQVWLKTQLASNDLGQKNIGLAAQRNLYRLSDNPYYRLQDDVFAIVEALAKNPSAVPTSKKARFIQHAIFHRRCQPPKLGQSPNAAGAAATAAPALVARASQCAPSTVGGFYRTLTLLARFPEWLLRFGFSYTVTVELSAGQALDSIALLGLPASCGAWTDPATGLTPSTKCTTDGYAAYLPPGQGTTFLYNSNLLALDSSKCKLVDNDVDGASLRLLQHANSVSLSAAAAAGLPPPNDKDEDQQDASPVANPGQEVALPSRSVGISLLHTDTILHQTTCLIHQYTDLRPNPNGPLGLVDLIRGYAPEISFRNDEWFSLTEREVTYNDEQTSLLQQYVAVHLEAAVHSDTPSSTGGDGAVDDLHIPQTLFRWNGWNLTVPSPFAVNKATCTSTSNSHPFPISAKYRARDGSLVRMRFGGKYLLRVRLVDLTGEVMNWATTTEHSLNAIDGTTLSISYLRHDPVSPPEVLLEGVIDGTKWPGETLTTLIGREGDNDHLPRRCLCPPVASLDLLLQHGVLDAPAGTIISKNGFLKLDQIGSFDDVWIDAKTGEFPTQSVTYDDGTKDNVPVFQPGVPLPSRTYLPDPMALYVQPEIVDLATQNVYSNFLSEPFYRREGDWPHARRLRVEMDSATGDAPYVGWRTDPIDHVRTLKVSVPKGWQIKLRLKCVPGRSKAELFAAGQLHESFFQQFLDDLRADFRDASLPDVTAIHKTLGDGGLPQYTPPREMIFVHAVQRPLAPSTLADCQPPVQTYDSRIATFTATATIGDRRSTGKIELLAGWDDIVDGDPVNGYSTQSTKAELTEYSLNTALLDSDKKPRTTQPFTAIAHTFPDTRCRILYLSANSVSRFIHYYKNSDKIGESSFSTADPSPKQVLLLSTSRPAALSVAKIIPLLPTRSIPNHHNHTHTQSRTGGAFRIFLDRPWYSSGFGEMLGVVLWGEDPHLQTPPIPNYTSARDFVPSAYHSWSGDPTLEPYVTRWGADPAGSTTIGTLAPVLDDFVSPPDAEGAETAPPTRAYCAFPAEMLTGVDDTHPENFDMTKVRYVSIAAYPVSFQQRTQLYYADVQIKKVPAYNTFLRLALTRYQPNSRVDRECSSIVIAAFAQLLDGRSVLAGC